VQLFTVTYGECKGVAPIVAFTGTMRSGKDTASDYLAEKYGFLRYSFATPMRSALEILDPYICPPASTPRRLTDILAEHGWEGLKNEPRVADEVRVMMQRFGTNWGRDHAGAGVWLYAADNALDAMAPGWGKCDGRARFAISDCRFANEAVWVRRLHHGKVIRIIRPGLPAQRGSDHSSEAGIPDSLIDYTILNAGDISELHGQLDDIMERIYGNVRA
jgi:hypothetical protein